MQIEKLTIPVVNVSVGQYLLEAFFDAGPTIPDPHVGEQPLRWGDVLDYAQASGEISEPWEMRILVQMSKAYVDAKMHGKNPLSRSPLEQKETSDEETTDR